jgi:hypothetical protein
LVRHERGHEAHARSRCAHHGVTGQKHHHKCFVR